jgi:RND family efflux transporter MFP subunit
MMKFLLPLPLPLSLAISRFAGREKGEPDGRNVTFTPFSRPTQEDKRGRGAGGEGEKWAIILLSLLLISGCQKASDTSAEAEKPEEPVSVVAITSAERHDIEETVTAQGTLQPSQGAMTKMAPTVGGRLVSVLVKEGDTVTAGQVVATLETKTLLAQTKSAEAGYQTAVAVASQSATSAQAAASDQESGVRIANLTLKATITERDAGIQAAQTALQLAEADLAKTLAGARPQEITQAESALHQSEATQGRAKTEVERQLYLFEKGVSAKRQLEDAQTALSLAVPSVESARQGLEIVKLGARKEERDAANLRVRQAKEQLEQAKKSGEAKVAGAKAALAQAEQQKLAVLAKKQEARAAQAGINKAQADVAVAKTQTEYATLKSPISGVVTRRMLNVGDMADPAASVLEISNNTMLDLMAQIPAEEASRVKVGQKARLSVENANILAIVASIGAVDSQTNLTPVRLRVSQAGKLRSGTFTLAKIIVRVSPQAVTVPKVAILSHEGKKLVMLMQNETAKETPVTTGVETEKDVEIRSGVSAGAKIITEGQYELADGAKVKLQEEKKEEKSKGE